MSLLKRVIMEATTMVTKVKEDRMTTTSELKPLLKRLKLGYKCLSLIHI